jgi:type I restriction enzyme, R subunit
MSYEQQPTRHPYAKGFSEKTVHREEVLEVHLCKALVEMQGYRPRLPDDYDRAAALDKALVLEFVRATQPEEWAKLQAHYSASSEETFFKQLEKALKDRGVLDVLRQGIKIVPGIKFTLCYFRPASALEPKRVAEYEANILSVTQQVEYSERNSNRLDAALFLNGLPSLPWRRKTSLQVPTFAMLRSNTARTARPQANLC